MSEAESIPYFLSQRGSGTLRMRDQPVFMSRTFEGGRLEGNSSDSTVLPTERADPAGEVRPRTLRVPWAIRPMRVAGEVFELKEKFDGVVLSKGDETFLARMVPTEADSGPAEAEFPYDELSSEDQALIEPGAPFVLTIGYRMDGSTRYRVAHFYMRRMPSMTEEQVSQASERALVFRDAVGWK